MSSLISVFAVILVGCSVGIQADLDIVKRSDWEAREPASELTDLNTPVAKVVIVHTSSQNCTDKEVCSQLVRNLQSFHMNSLHFDDIAYNFLIGNDGNVYEGRGWDKMGAFAKGFNYGSLGIAFIGMFDKVLPTVEALGAARALIAEGISLEKITDNYKLLGHRQLGSTISPGTALYNEIKTWPKWSPRV